MHTLFFFKTCRRWRKPALKRAALFLLVGLGLTLTPAITSAQTRGPTAAPKQGGSSSIAGKISNGTVGASSQPTQQNVKLEQVTGNNEDVAELHATTDANGSFVFQNLPVGDNYTYFVSTRYAGVTYYAQAAVKLSSVQATQNVVLKVYETTNDAVSVSVQGTTVVIPQVDAVSGQLTVLEMYTVQNSTDRAFVGAKQNQTSATTATPDPNERVATLRFFLPTGATGLTPAAGINPGDIVETTDGIEVSSPILPGENQFVFSYRLAYQNQTFSFNKRLSYDTPAFRFFIPLDGPKATSSQLTPGQPVQMGQQRLATLTGQTFRANTQLQVELTDLPFPPDRGVIAVRDSILKISITLLTLSSLIFLGFYLRRRNQTLSLGDTFATSEAGTARQKATLDDTLEIDQEQRRLLHKLARLDITYDKGDFAGGETAYQRQRQELKVQLIETWQGQALKEELDVIAGN